MKEETTVDLRYDAFRAWRDLKLPISMAARVYGVEREEIMDTFRREEPSRYYWFMAKLHFALTVANWLVLTHSLLRDFRNFVGRSLQ